ncbi:hypothetical protein [Streptococcus mutans]|uniref:hypothetical protein n=1 Tax=Streptococcus mutans TaxID=1309 RepID=UPI000464C004|nr:hypothetical protein [Streptococcus mutans]NLQ50150.1 hypothetical protein [Streptococcus mutans]
MNKKSIFKASFEESLNLEDDGFRKLQQEQHDKTAKHFKTGRISFWFRIQSFIFALLFSIGLNFFLLSLALILYTGSSNDLTMPISQHNFLSVNIYLVLLLVWLLLVVIGKIVKRLYLLPYRYQFHIFTTMIWTIIEGNLIAVNLALPSLSSWGVIAVFIFVTILAYFMLTFKIKSLRKLMYGTINGLTLHDKVANMIAIYGMGFLGIGVFIRIILSGFSINFSTSTKVLGLFLMWIIANIVVIAITILIEIPYFLQAYYKWKYPEEYREWEGKSLEEWYGKKYLKKHPELLKRDLQ